MNESLVNVLSNLQPWWGAFKSISVFIGLALAITGLYHLGKPEKTRGSGKVPLLILFSGVMLTNQSLTMDALSMTIFMETSRTGLEVDVNSGAASERFILFIKLSVTLIILVGYYGFTTGWVLLSKSSSQTSTLGPAIAHIGGGIAAINVEKVIMMFAKTVGGDFYMNAGQYFG